MADAETSTVRLIHHTLQEYLSRPGTELDAHKTLAQTCLAYLNYELVKELPANDLSNFRDIPFLEYSSLYWGRHAKAKLSDRARSLALKLLNQFSNHISATFLLHQIENFHPHPSTHHLFPGLHCASYFGIVEIVEALIGRKGYDINQRDCMGLTSLIHAAREGNEEVVRLLLTRDDINPDMACEDRRTPLSGACENGHDGVVALLLARSDVNPNEPDNDGQTPLFWASGNGHEEAVRLLLTWDDINPDMQDNDGQTAL